MGGHRQALANRRASARTTAKAPNPSGLGEGAGKGLDQRVLGKRFRKELGKSVGDVVGEWIGEGPGGGEDVWASRYRQVQEATGVCKGSHTDKHKQDRHSRKYSQAQASTAWQKHQFVSASTRDVTLGVEPKS